MTLVDTNVLLDIFSRDADWFSWSLENLETRSTEGALVINEVIYAELSARVETESILDELIAEVGVRLDRMPKSALFQAGKAFERYRRSGGTRTGVLPDFFIGAHAQVARLPILTRDIARYRTYFPNVGLIAPEA